MTTHDRTTLAGHFAQIRELAERSMLELFRETPNLVTLGTNLNFLHETTQKVAELVSHTAT